MTALFLSCIIGLIFLEYRNPAESIETIQPWTFYPEDTDPSSFSFLQGFKALLRYEGFDDDNSRDFWRNLCVPEIHPVGWCASTGKPLVPPKCEFEGCDSVPADLVAHL